VRVSISILSKPKTLKITEEDYKNLSDAVLSVVKKHPDAYAEYKAKNLSDMRYNWDVFRASGFDITPLYKYLNDSHINAALAAILKNKGKGK